MRAAKVQADPPPSKPCAHSLLAKAATFAYNKRESNHGYNNRKIISTHPYRCGRIGAAPRSLSNYIESIFYRIGYKPSSTQQVITPELQARIDKAREEIRSGNCTVIRSQEALNDYLDNL